MTSVSSTNSYTRPKQILPKKSQVQVEVKPKVKAPQPKKIDVSKGVNIKA